MLLRVIRKISRNGLARMIHTVANETASFGV